MDRRAERALGLVVRGDDRRSGGAMLQRRFIRSLRIEAARFASARGRTSARPEGDTVVAVVASRRIWAAVLCICPYPR
jgi:hypothetical protein